MDENNLLQNKGTKGFASIEIGTSILTIIIFVTILFSASTALANLTIYGNIIDQDGKPVASATVTAYDMSTLFLKKSTRKLPDLLRMKCVNFTLINSKSLYIRSNNKCIFIQN